MQDHIELLKKLTAQVSKQNDYLSSELPKDVVVTPKKQPVKKEKEPTFGLNLEYISYAAKKMLKVFTG